MADYKKNTDHLTNAALAAPVLLATGNIPAAIVALGLGKVLDMAEDRDFEERRRRWKEENRESIPFTFEEQRKIREENHRYSDIIDNISQIKEAEKVKMYVFPFCPHTTDKKGLMTTLGGCLARLTVKGVVSKSQFFFPQSDDIPATIYYMAKDFAEQLNKDIKNPKLKVYRIGFCHGSGQWMYTVDNGKSYVVGA